MTTAAPLYDGAVSQAMVVRVQSIDMFRVLTIAVMIFVNDLSGVHGLTWWTYHMPAYLDAVTYVDMVFTCFLFIVGLSIPLAVKHRQCDHLQRKYFQVGRKTGDTANLS